MVATWPMLRAPAAPAKRRRAQSADLVQALAQGVAAPASQFRTHVADHAKVGRHELELLRGIFIQGCRPPPQDGQASACG